MGTSPCMVMITRAAKILRKKKRQESLKALFCLGSTIMSKEFSRLGRMTRHFTHEENTNITFIFLSNNF